MAGAIITVVIAYTICFAIWLAARNYVNKCCRDNDPIVWIWLDDEPEDGTKANVTDRFQYLQLAFSSGAC